jgi:hypothetical protein
VAPQALFMMNNSFVIAQSTRLARRVLDARELDPEARINLAYRLALGRAADERDSGR